MKQAIRAIVGLLMMGAALSALSGCEPKTEMSKDDIANFKGGPMPKDYQANKGAKLTPPADPAKGGK